MKIILVHPPNPQQFILGDMFSPEPLALEYIAAGVGDAHEVRIFDMRFESNWQETLSEFSPDIVGFTATSMHVNTVKKICRELKANNPEIKTIVGGHHATVKPQDFYHPYLDYVCIGEGMWPFQELVAKLERGQRTDDIVGIACCQNGDFKFNGVRFFTDLDALPFPNRELTRNLRYHLFAEDMRGMTLMMTSKGCPFRCNYCSCWKLTDGKYLMRDLDSIIDEMKIIEDPMIHFADDESYVNTKRMIELAAKIAKSGITKEYSNYARADTIVKCPELFERWRDIGLNSIIIGLESHSDQYLDKYNKGCTRELNEKALKVLNDLKISVIASFIIEPGFDERDFDELGNYVVQLDIDYPFFNILTPFPGSQLFEANKHRLTTHDYDLFDFCHAVLPTKLSLKRFYSEVAHLYVKVAQAHRNQGKKIQEMYGKYFSQERYGKVLFKQKRAYLDHQ